MSTQVLTVSTDEDHNFSGQHVPVFHHPHSKNVFSCIVIELPIFEICGHCLISSVGMTDKNLYPSSLPLSVIYMHL